MENIIFPVGLTSIEKSAFIGCGSLKKIEMPAELTYIGESAFSYCKNLETICFLGDAPEFSENVFVSINAIAYYPKNNKTWVNDVMQQYGGNISWVPYDPSIIYDNC